MKLPFQSLTSYLQVGLAGENTWNTITYNYAVTVSKCKLSFNKLMFINIPVSKNEWYSVTLAVFCCSVKRILRIFWKLAIYFTLLTLKRHKPCIIIFQFLFCLNAGYNHHHRVLVKLAILWVAYYISIGETAIVKKQEAQLPQRNSASAAHVYLGWLTDRAMHRIAEVVLFLTFKRSDSRNAGEKRILSWNNHSRSFILHSFAGRQGVPYRHILLLAVSVKFSKT